jgi:hypothetical protein
MLAPDKIVFLYGTKRSIPLLFLTKEIGEREYSMKITVATFSAILFVSGFSPLAHAQAQIAVPEALSPTEAPAKVFVAGE